jgi:hypothetical protein
MIPPLDKSYLFTSILSSTSCRPGEAPNTEKLDYCHSAEATAVSTPG